MFEFVQSAIALWISNCRVIRRISHALEIFTLNKRDCHIWCWNFSFNVYVTDIESWSLFNIKAFGEKPRGWDIIYSDRWSIKRETNPRK